MFHGFPHNLAESLMDACINKGAVQYQEAERTSDVFQTVLTDVSLNSDIFFVDFGSLEVKKIWFIRTNYWDMMKSWLGFGDLDLIFKVTVGLKLPNLSPKVLVCTISHELVGRFQPDLHGYNIGTWWRANLILVTLTYFSRSVRDLNCQIWAKRCLCAQYLMNQLADFNQICMDITFGHGKMLNRFLWPWSNFQGHCQT